MEQIVTGAPPAVITYQIKPSNWSSNNQFSIEWENPNWQRDLLGLNIEIRENKFGFERFDYVEFPSDQALSSHQIEVQESGIYDVSVWLVDELGNDNPSTKNIKLKI